MSARFSALRQRLLFGAPGAQAVLRGGSALGADSAEPCRGCPFDDGRPQVYTCGDPAAAKALVVGEALWKDEVREGVNFIGAAGVKLRKALARLGLPAALLATGNVVSCQPNQIDAEDPAFRAAAEHCVYHLRAKLLDLAPRTPLLLLGGVSVSWLWPRPPQGTAPVITEVRGLRRLGDGGRMVFAAFHPSYVLRAEGNVEDGPICRRWLRDLERFADYALGRERKPEERFEVLTTEGRARTAVARLERAAEWAFDLETTGLDPRADGAVILSAAFAVGGGEAFGFGVGHPDTPWSLATGKMLLRRALASGAGKVAKNGIFDLDWALTHLDLPFVPGYQGDPQLASFLRNPVKRRSVHSLERLVVDVLDEPTWWDGADKSRIREYPLKDVLMGSMRDAERALRLHRRYLAMMEDGEFYADEPG